MAEEDQQYDPMAEINYLRSLIDSIDNQTNNLVRGLDELRRAHSALNDENILSSRDTRVSLGAGVYASAKIEMNRNFLVPIGSRVYIEESREKAVSRMDSNIKEIEASLQSMYNQRTELSNRYQALVSMVQQQTSSQEQDQQ